MLSPSFSFLLSHFPSLLLGLGQSHPLALHALAQLALLYRDHSYFEESEGWLIVNV